MSITTIQSRVAARIAAAATTTAIVFGVAVAVPWLAVPDVASLPVRLQWAAMCSLVPIAALVFCIARLALRRFTAPEDIDASAAVVGSDRARILQAILQNSLEQAVVAVALYFAAALVLQAPMFTLVPAAAVLFVVGRVLFFVGYRHGAAARAVGFGLTFYPSLGILLALLFTIPTRGIA